jgi:hypothetical protein
MTEFAIWTLEPWSNSEAQRAASITSQLFYDPA